MNMINKIVHFILQKCIVFLYLNPFRNWDKIVGE